MFQDLQLLEHWQIASPIFGFLVAIYLMTLNDKRFFSDHKSSLLLGIGLTVWVWFWIGTRFKYHYTDCMLYAQMFEQVQTGQWLSLKSSPSEWFWDYFEYIFIQHGDIRGWYLGVAAFYVGCMALVAYILMPKNYFIAIAFLFTAYSFFSYGTNGIRNGMATSIAMLALALISSNILKNKLLSYLLGFSLLYLASSTHQTLLLVLGSAVCAILVENIRIYLGIWCICILVSIVLGNTIYSFFSFFIDDHRFMSYATANVDSSVFSRTGFRWDFLLYSAIPIALGYYACIKKKIKDPTYNMLLNTYILSNAFWVCVNSVAYSNRFAYLSWFLLPILVAYPLVKFKLFKKQGLVAGGFMLFFTIFNLIF